MTIRRMKNRARATQRSGFAMLLVLILVVTAVILGMSYLSSAAIHTAVSKNLIGQTQARYLAESGMQHGMYLLRTDPTVSGMKGPFTLRGCTDTYTVNIAAVSGQLNTWTIDSTAHVKQASRKSSATIQRIACPPITMKKGILVGNGSVTFPSALTINGDVHINGSLSNLARITGSASATQGVLDWFRRIDGSINGSANSVTPPQVTVAQYSGSYALNGHNYTAASSTSSDFKTTSSFANDGAITTSNVGGVLYIHPSSGTVKLWANLKFHGTIVIDGNVEIYGSGVKLTAVDGFPAIVATGSIKMDSNATADISGLVVAKHGIVSNGANSNSQISLNGGLLCDDTGVSSGLSGGYTVTYQQAQAEIYDFSLNSSLRVPKVSVVNWND